MMHEIGKPHLIYRLPSWRYFGEQVGRDPSVRAIQVLDCEYALLYQGRAVICEVFGIFENRRVPQWQLSLSRRICEAVKDVPAGNRERFQAIRKIAKCLVRDRTQLNVGPRPGM